MPKFQLAVTIRFEGYIELDAPDEADARKQAQALEADVDFGLSSEIDTSYLSFGEVTVDGCSLVEDEADA